MSITTHFHHSAVNSHLDDVKRVILSSTVVVEPYLSRQPFDLDLRINKL